MVCIAFTLHIEREHATEQASKIGRKMLNSNARLVDVNGNKNVMFPFISGGIQRSAVAIFKNTQYFTLSTKMSKIEYSKRNL